MEPLLVSLFRRCVYLVPELHMSHSGKNKMCIVAMNGKNVGTTRKLETQLSDRR